MPEINLLQQESGGLKKFHIRQGSRSTLYFVSILLAFELAIWGFIIFSQRKITGEMSELDQRSASIDLEVSKNDPARKQAIAAQIRLIIVESLLNSHIFWSQAFSELESKTYKPIQLQSLQVDNINNKFTLTGIAASQKELAKFMLGLQTSSHFSDIILRNSTAEQGQSSGYLFSLEFAFSPELLLKK